ncbi:hypothetical protein SAMN05216356_12315 [Oribacterium sp. WCC10]|nr:hypothetical protein SAMN05216356_12315 [Oribacterium sp. WCC10]
MDYLSVWKTLLTITDGAQHAHIRVPLAPIEFLGK